MSAFENSIIVVIIPAYGQLPFWVYSVCDCPDTL